MLRTLRRTIATVVFVLLTLLFLDFTGTLQAWFGWLAKVQFIPAILAGSAILIAAVCVFTLVFGRVYCSVVCPLGVMQDGISHISGRRKGKKNRFSFSKPVTWLRLVVLVLFVAGFVAGMSAVVSLLDPYAAYGRIASSFLAPLYGLGNNVLAWLNAKAGGYALYPTEVFVKSWVVFGVALVTLVAVGVLAWRNGRTYCNTICPVGSFLGVFSSFAIFRPMFDFDKCTKCGLCEKGCKASCINSKVQTIDLNRCVGCFNCIEKCSFDAMHYRPVWRSAETKRTEPSVKSAPTSETAKKGVSRRTFLSIATLFTVGGSLKAQQLHVDGGLAEIEDKKVPNRKTPVTPPGAVGAAHLKAHCSACQLCVSECPNNVLHPSARLATLMQPEMTFERGYCRPECTNCSQVCPTGAIRPITPADKTATAIGHAVWIADNCIVNRDGVQCTACSGHCPAGAIALVALDPTSEKSLKIPVVNKEMCIGCGACEYLCPARPFAAIYVEGNERHHTV
ncbi:MAG: 4Fe-4S dicluster domain-containing protein [Rikenellaceae bacterium]|nr:4Fe-4S dicluster domain-containing protein [Rikenellaceae bacterium]